MGKEQSKLQKQGYVIQRKMSELELIATKDDDIFYVKIIHENKLSKEKVKDFISEMEILQKTSHSHVVNMKNSFEDDNMYYVVMELCLERNLSAKIKEDSPESQILSWIVEICMGLKVLHEAALCHKDLMPKNVSFAESGLVILGGFGNLNKKSESQENATSNATLNYLAPEVFTEGTYEAKSDIWSVGCILYELCTKKQAFSAENAVSLIPKIISGASPRLPKGFSPDLCDLLSDLLKKDPQERPTASEILARPAVLKCLMTKTKTTLEDLHTKLKALRALADGLERIHEGTTIGSLTGGVIGAVGGITSIVGLALTPVTFGASLIVTGVGVGVGALGGITAGASNVTKMVNQSSDRKTVRSIIKEIEQKIRAVVTWLLEINSGLQTISSRCPEAPDDTESDYMEKNLTSLGLRAGRGLSGVSELVRLARVLTIGKIAAQTSRVVRVAEVATGVLSGLFLAVDFFFIAMDAKEIHHIKKAREEEKKATPSPSSGSELDTTPTFDQAKLSLDSEMQESDTAKTPETEVQSTPEKSQIRSEIMKFVLSVRKSADDLEKVLNELETMFSSIPVFQEENEQEMSEMELM